MQRVPQLEETPAPPRQQPTAGASSPRRVLFDDVDVPDFLKNGA